jgi:hypothetical protein
MDSSTNKLDFDDWHILDHQPNSTHHYNENQDDDLDNGLLPQVWGPPTWKSLHYISFGYPLNPAEEDMIHYKMFFKMIGYVLPCKSCRDSYRDFIETGSTKMTDDVFRDRRSLTYWLYSIHEAVNKKIGVSYGTTYEDLVEICESFRAKCSKMDSKCTASLPPTRRDEVNYEYTGDCDIIPYGIAKYFREYGRKRGVIEFDSLEQLRDIQGTTKADIWNRRNSECYAIIKHMREGRIPSIEQEGEFRGLPTYDELRLIARMSTSMRPDVLKGILHRMGYPNYPGSNHGNPVKLIYLPKKYKFVA